MCGFVAYVGNKPYGMGQASYTLRHRGPDAAEAWMSPEAQCGISHNRLAILDLDERANQPMTSPDGRYTIALNGEIYNYLELKAELGGDWHTKSDTEVLLRTYAKWGKDCLPRLIGMFAFVIWDDAKKILFAARDRFGKKPLFYHANGPDIWIASEIKALHKPGVPKTLNEITWATYLATGNLDTGYATFWKDIERLPPGHSMTIKGPFKVQTERWYDPGEGVETDVRDDEMVHRDLCGILDDSVEVRFRSDVPVGVCLSGGVDSSLLLALIRRQGHEVPGYSFWCDDSEYDEIPWVKAMQPDAHFALLTPEMVPELALEMFSYQDEPYGGIPTLGMAKVFEQAQKDGVKVLLDGQGMDEGWAGYDWMTGKNGGSPSVLPECLNPDFRSLARRFSQSKGLRAKQLNDLTGSKIPRATRFNDRASMMHSVEVRSPFLDHRVVELGLRQPDERKVRDGTGKWLVRELARTMVPERVAEAPKRTVQTPQREWLRGPLWMWADDWIMKAYESGWLNRKAVYSEWTAFRDGKSDNSNYIWQWIMLGMMLDAR